MPGLAPGGIGARLLSYDVLVYLALPTSLLTWWLIFRTRWGLGLRTVGENPAAAYAAGLRPQRLQYQALAFAGALGGIAGAHMSVALTLTWAEGMTAGRGFIAIALVIFAKWNPLWAIAGALLFGGAEGLQLQLQAAGADVSPFVMNMTPYLLTLLGAHRLGMGPPVGGARGAWSELLSGWNSTQSNARSRRCRAAAT